MYDYIQRTLKTGSETYTFDLDGRLIKIKDEYDNETVIGYENGRITTVKDGADRTFTFSYVDSCYLEKITAPDDTFIQYTSMAHINTAQMEMIR